MFCWGKIFCPNIFYFLISGLYDVWRAFNNIKPYNIKRDITDSLIIFTPRSNLHSSCFEIFNSFAQSSLDILFPHLAYFSIRPKCRQSINNIVIFFSICFLLIKNTVLIKDGWRLRTIRHSVTYLNIS